MMAYAKASAIAASLLCGCVSGVNAVSQLGHESRPSGDRRSASAGASVTLEDGSKLGLQYRFRNTGAMREIEHGVFFKATVPVWRRQ